MMNRLLQNTSRLFQLLAVVILILSYASDSLAQSPRTKTSEPQDVSLSTKDGVNLHCRFFPGAKGKESVPIIMIHGWEGSSGDFAGLAARLQKSFGYAVIVPDLRGHGRSTTRHIAARSDVQDIRRDRFKPNDIRNMVGLDLETVKKFLMEQHNAGKLNIELLCVVGVEMGSVLAANWVAQDWSWPQLPAMKQGQDARAIVLISPLSAFKGLKLLTAFTKSHKSVRSNLSALIVHSKSDSTSSRTSKQLHNILKRYHVDRPNDDQAEQDLFLFGLDGARSGNSLARDSRVANALATFIDRRLVRKSDRYPWTERQNPFAN